MVIGGVVSSTLLTLLVLPVLYDLVTSRGAEAQGAPTAQGGGAGPRVETDPEPIA